MSLEVLFRFLPPCPFHYFTGLYCPGCGSTRAIAQLLHGNILKAIHFNPLTVFFVILLGGYSLFYAVSWIRKQQVPHVFIRPVWIWLLLAAILIFWVLRNIPVYPFSLLAPY